MTGTFLQALRVGTLVIAIGGGTLLLGQVAALYVVVHVLGSVVSQMLG